MSIAVSKPLSSSIFLYLQSPLWSKLIRCTTSSFCHWIGLLH
jgi:hypothetical protein